MKFVRPRYVSVCHAPVTFTALRTLSLSQIQNNFMRIIIEIHIWVLPFALVTCDGHDDIDTPIISADAR
jgi:hypothetical protein